MSDNASEPTPSVEELHRIAKSLGALHHAVQNLEGDAWQRAFGERVAGEVLGDPDRELSHEQRREVLGEVRTSLNRVIDGFGLWPDRFPPHPEVLVATDRTPRREVWETALRNLVGDRLFVQWPKPLQEHIVTAAVEQESAALAQGLKDYYSDVREALPTWEWDPDQLVAVHDEGELEPANEPDIDAYLGEARANVELFLGHTQVAAVADWIDEQLQTLDARGWTVDHTQNYEQADLSWHLDPEQAHLSLRTPPHAHLKEALRRFTAEEAAAYPLLARALANAVAATAPSPAQAAFPQIATDQSSAAAAGEFDPDTTAAPEPETTGPQR